MYKTSVFILKTILSLAIFGSASTTIVHAQQDMSIQSTSMQETREITVHLPENYDPNSENGYPVIYMLDAGIKDRIAAELASYYNWGDIMPEVIVVGLKNVRRGMDFLPGYYSVEGEGQQHFGNGSKLLTYIKDELIPFINQEFKTSDRRVFAGHSWAGQYVTYVLSQSPDLFDAYFITSPSFGSNNRWGGKTFDAMEQILKQDHDFPEFVYLSVGGDEEFDRLADYHRLSALLRQHLPERTKFYHEIHTSAVHQSNGVISLTKALQLYFSTVNTN